MIALPGAGLDVDVAPGFGDAAAVGPLPASLEATVERARGWGGDPGLYRAALARGLAVLAESGAGRADAGAGEDTGTPDRLGLAIAVMAAWRAGVIDLRDDALERARAELASATAGDSASTLAASTLAASALAATLGLPVADLGPFLDAQLRDRFAWPSATSGAEVARLGGFRGTGGAWLAPPDDAAGLGDGRFRIRSAGEVWIARADVFGATLRSAEGAADEARSEGRADTVVPVIATPSYLVRLVRR